jgi:hypothetical protein
MIWVFGVGYLTSVAIGAHALHALWRIASGRLRDDELVQVTESEEIPHDAVHPGARP